MKKQILIVDDELSILKLLHFILSEKYDLEVKSNGAEALSWLEDGNYPDLIISDMAMPYIDGSAFIRNLKISGLFRNIPVIMLSSAEDLEEKVMEMGFEVTYFSKPFNPLDLKSAIVDILKTPSLDAAC